MSSRTECLRIIPYLADRCLTLRLVEAGLGVNKKCKVHLCREGRVVDAPVWRRGALDTGGGRQIRQPLKTRKPASRGTEG